MRNSKLSIDLIRTIVVQELSLDGERVNMYNQEFAIPTDDKLFVVIQYKASPSIISSRNSVELIGGVYTEVQDLNTLEDITIGLFSKNLEALQRKEEVVMALSSIYSRQIQEEYSFKIYPNPSIQDLSFLEGSAMLTRVDVDIRVNAWYNKTKTAEYLESTLLYVSVNDGLPNMTETIDVTDQ